MRLTILNFGLGPLGFKACAAVLRRFFLPPPEVAEAAGRCAAAADVAELAAAAALSDKTKRELKRLRRPIIRKSTWAP